MIKKEFKKIWQNKLLFVTVIVVSLIPILYASVFLKSIWDPYGNMSELPVAVVNLDETVDFQGKTLNVGSELVDNLKKNSDLDWNFVSQSAAKKGLKNRKYYMIVTIPKDFSKNAATVLDSDPEKMNLKYETNAGVNYLGEVVSDNAMKQLKAQVSEKVTKSYATAIIATIKELGSGMTTAAEGSEKLNDGANQVNTGVGTLAESVPTLADGVSQLDNGAGSLKSGVSQYTAGVAQVADGSNQLNTGVGQLTSQLPTLTNGLSALGTGANSLSAGLTQYTGGVAQVASGTSQLQTKLNNELIPAIKKLSNGASELSSSLNKVSLANPKNGTSSADNKELLISYLDGVNNLLESINKLDLSPLENIGQLTESFNSIKNNLINVSNNLTTVKNTLSEEKIHEAMALDVQSNTTSIVNDLQSSNSELGLTPQQMNQIQNVVSNSLKKNSTNSNLLGLISDSQNQLLAISQNLQVLSTTLTEIQQYLSPELISELSSTSEKLKLVTSKLSPNAQLATDSLKKVLDVITLIETQASPGATALANGLSTIQNQIPILAAGVSQVATGANTLNNNSAQLTSGANQLANGLSTVNEKTPALASGVNQLANGVSTLANGANTLNSKSGELNDGTAKLADGLDTLNGKIPSLSSGVLQLKDGTSQLAAGTNELATKLKTGSDKINDLSLSDKTADMIANPAEETQTKYSSVPNYGHALAPYFMSVSLFVGSLVFNFVYPIRKIADRKGASAAQWFRSKVTIGGLVATTMALVIGTVMQMIGLTVSNQWQLYGILLATAWVNMFLIMFLAMSFDNPGRFIAVLLLVVQLGSAGGVFPMEITSRFYNIVHPYIPMTYSIYGLRQSISTGLGNELYNQSLLILVVLIIALLALLRLSMQILFKRGLAGYSQLHNTQKLLDDDYMNKREKYTLW
ncbi:YhgE/Pip domain-containing protein [uncultured Enterococcus sp.]|uniref:YhgE/Pip domain-containing protein n=1 Tax=uncultured Enterococcus sp. TaxID=167972 RepID=UPI00259142D1|nr:YhgE/Pip domain-containing protein [uncultured Enterococcus sp.]